MNNNEKTVSDDINNELVMVGMVNDTENAELRKNFLKEALRVKASLNDYPNIVEGSPTLNKEALPIEKLREEAFKTEDSPKLKNN